MNDDDNAPHDPQITNDRTSGALSRRGMVAAAAWTVPVIALASATPAQATSAGSTFTVDVVSTTVVRGQSSEVIARVLDSAGQPWAGQSVSLTVTDSAGITFAVASGTTDGAGEFRTTLTVGASANPGQRTLTATSDAVAATDTFTVLLSNVVGAGANTQGSLGDGTTTNRSTPTFSSPVFPSRVTQTATRRATTGASTYFLLADGTVWSVGVAAGLGDGTASNRSIPAQIPGLAGVTQIVASGAGGGYALLASGEVRSWGSNTNGQLGNGTTTTSATPVTVLAPGGTGPLTGITELAAGSVHVVALSTSGQVYAWGNNTNGQLGIGTTAQQTLPTVVPGLSGVTSIGAGFTSGFAVLSSGEGRVWGGGGTTYTSNQLSPVVVRGAGGVGALSGIRRIVGGFTTSFAILTSGEVRAWGTNTQGQLGNGGTTDSVTPVVVQAVGGGGALSGVTQVAAGNNSGQALLTSGQVVTWGGDNNGQQGAGTTGVNRLVPGAYILPAGKSATSIGLVTHGNVGGAHFAILND